ncbi:hypothetical protein MM300_06700 [Evansella sp. LMS18]|jgi:hypothetical protein|uniref:hypothetical protein n=1 Tax=Evansella sp. LMS18 TaxID=2924033 RepID=UPI0020D07D91|nr:hypothetical protein [Evansella sp. LMS18]UTR11978.1 hypothetical protein MM300_06700 [Evansella sp. LMS18]
MLLILLRHPFGENSLLAVNMEVAAGLIAREPPIREIMVSILEFGVLILEIMIPILEMVVPIREIPPSILEIGVSIREIEFNLRKYQFNLRKKHSNLRKSQAVLRKAQSYLRNEQPYLRKQLLFSANETSPYSQTPYTNADAMAQHWSHSIFKNQTHILLMNQQVQMRLRRKILRKALQ